MFLSFDRIGRIQPPRFAVVCFANERYEMISLRWRHNGCDSVSNHQPRECLLRRLIRRTSKKTSKFRVTGLWVNSPHKWPVTRKMSPFDDVIMSALKLTLYFLCDHDHGDEDDGSNDKMMSTTISRAATATRLATIIREIKTMMIVLLLLFIMIMIIIIMININISLLQLYTKLMIIISLVLMIVIPAKRVSPFC